VAATDTDFILTLNGAQSLMGTNNPVQFKVSCWSQSPRTPPTSQQKTIKIIRDMYPRDSPIIEALLSDVDCSHILLCTDDRYSWTLLCEISFHLYDWEALATPLGLDEDDIYRIKLENSESKFFVKAFELLSTWLKTSECSPTLKLLKNALQSIGLSFFVTSWNSTYGDIVPKRMDNVFVAKIGKFICCYWKFIGHLLGLPKIVIEQAKTYARDNLCEQACIMMNEWMKCFPGDERGAYFELFDSIHCVCEHVHIRTLKAALSYLE